MNSNIDKSAIGLDLGGTNLHLGIIEHGQVTYQEDIPFQHSDDVQEEVNRVSEKLKPWILKYPHFPVGVACAGFFNYRENRIMHGVNFKAVADRTFFPLLSKNLNINKIAYLNDADSAALGSAFLNQTSIFHFTLGTGVGTGAAVPNQIFYHVNGYGIDLGHAEFSDKENFVACNCGSKFCMESYWGKKGLEYFTRMSHPDIKEMRDAPENILEEAQFESHIVMFQKFIRFVQLGFGPDIISFSGGNSRFFTDKIQARLVERCLEAFPIPKIKVFKDREKRMLGVLGAALYVTGKVKP